MKKKISNGPIRKGLNSSQAEVAIQKNKESKKEGSAAEIMPWPEFIRISDDEQITNRFAIEVKQIIAKHSSIAQAYCCLALLEPSDSIGSFDLNKIFNALVKLNPLHSKDVLLILLSKGGSIEPAYQISKLCKLFSKNRFVAIVPRQAKSAATLIAIGADEIHMGLLGQLGPIDPQLDGLPALGVSQALKSIASLAEKYPGSADMFARYLRRALTVEQIGYCERISESAVQYAERLLSTKTFSPGRVGIIAKELVHEYKDHGFVIDLEEARKHLGATWIKSDTSEIAFAEEIYKYFDMINLYLRMVKSKRLLIIGEVSLDIMILNNKE